MSDRQTTGHTLLLGNGVNQGAGGESWESLLATLDQHGRFEASERKDGSISFPFLFEALLNDRRYHATGDKKKEALSEMKGEVAQSVHSMQAIALHQDVIALPVDHIFTTNYDYTLENASNPKRLMVPKSASAKTNRIYYSLHRYRELHDGRRVWHIHGEANQPASIMLGFEHYVKSTARLEKYLIQNNLVSRSGTKTTEPVDTQEQDKSWVDHFLTSTVHVVGLGLSTDESMLWHLLFARHQRQLAAEQRGEPKPPPIHFYDPKIGKRNVGVRAHWKLLESAGVTVHPLYIGKGKRKYINFYKSALREIKRAIDAG